MMNKDQLKVAAAKAKETSGAEGGTLVRCVDEYHALVRSVIECQCNAVPVEQLWTACANLCVVGHSSGSRKSNEHHIILSYHVHL